MRPLGDGALRFARPATLDARELLERLRAWPRVVDAVVTEEHACIYFDPGTIPDDPTEAMARWAHEPPDRLVRTVTVRARYDGADLDLVARRTALSVDDVIRLHAAREYVVVTVGFLPGFAYLGGLDPRLVLPRLERPRARVEAGAIGIAASYTGVYPFASPGGWNLIATAVDFCPFSPKRGARLALGDRVRFEPEGPLPGAETHFLASTT